MVALDGLMNMDTEVFLDIWSDEIINEFNFDS